jgi:hypothetical protein
MCRRGVLNIVPTGDWKVPGTRRLESLRYDSLGTATRTKKL